MQNILFPFVLAFTCLQLYLAEERVVRYAAVSELLNEKLLVNDTYNTILRPRFDLHQPVIVHVDFTLSAIHSLDQKEQELSILGYFTLTWTDDFIKEFFESMQQEGIHVTDFAVPASKLWTPDCTMKGSNDLTALDTSALLAKIGASGTVTIFLGGNLKFTCALNLRLFPFDQQTCTIEFSSIISTAQDVVFLSSSPVSKIAANKGEWLLRNVSAMDKMLTLQNSNYSEIVYEIVIQRGSLVPVMTIVIPTVLQTLLVIIAFLIPPVCGERVSYVITVFLAFSVWSASINDSLPRAENTMPQLAIALNLLMGMSALSVLQSIVVVRLHGHGKDKRTATPTWVWCCLRKISPGKVTSPDPLSCSWPAVAAALDKASFWAYLMVILSCSLFLTAEYVNTGHGGKPQQ